MSTDEDMYVSAIDKKCKPFTTTINEELGQVQYIFSDKTGTLTCNQMMFKGCLIGNQLYGKSGKNLDLRAPTFTNTLSKGKIKKMRTYRNKSEIEINQEIFTFKDRKLFDIIKGKTDKKIYFNLQNPNQIQKTVLS